MSKKFSYKYKLFHIIKYFINFCIKETKKGRMFIVARNNNINKNIKFEVCLPISLFVIEYAF